jgi:hypothetical protein
MNVMNGLFKNPRVIASRMVRWAWLASLALPEPLAASTGDERAVFTMHQDITKNDPATGRFRFDGKTRLVDPKVVSTRRGTAIIRLQVRGPVHPFPSHFGFAPGPPNISFKVQVEWHKDEKAQEDRTLLDCVPIVVLRQDYTNSSLETLKPDKALTFAPGTELHLVWTWSGIQHRLYCNGKLLRDYTASSPFPSEFAGDIRALSNMGDDLLRTNPVKELTLYNFPFTPEEVQRDLLRRDSQALVPDAPHPASITAQWGPGERKVYAASEAGFAAARATRCRFMVLNRDGMTLASSEATSKDGFAEALIPVRELGRGSFRARAEWFDEAQHMIAHADSTTWTCPQVEWLGNTTGLSQKVQPPWTPVRARGNALEVWGRSYTVAGGFGLPQQIVSQGREQLASPVRLAITQDGKELPFQDASSTISTVDPHEGRWAGSAKAGDVKIAVRGTLAYDGMALLHLRLETAAREKPTCLDAITLDTRLPKDRALFLNTSTDQGYWWYPFKGRIPESPGLVLDNVKQRAGKTNFLFYALFSDHDTGLEWFADNLAGWQIDEARSVQEIIRAPDGSVLLRCHLANRPFILDRPIEITFGYDATPVKPLPEDWRLIYCHHHLIPSLDQYRGVWWLWEHASYNKFRPGVFTLEPENMAGFARVMREPDRPLMVPFTNQHVLVPSYPDTKPDRGWEWFQNIVAAETENTGWDSVPSRAARDCWAFHFDRFLRDGGISGIYIDEANTATVGSSLLSGAGWSRPDGTHAFGHNTLGMREQLKRLRQVFLDQGKRPLIWLPVYGKIIPHAHAFADVVSEGEAFMFNKPEEPDFIDAWGAPDSTGAGDWLLSLGPAQKFGFATLFLDYHRYFDHPRYFQSLRTMYGLLGLLDITPVNPQHAWYFKLKQDFGMAWPETTFHRYFEQQEIRSDRGEVKVSYYRRKGRILAIATNLGNSDVSATLAFDLPALGLDTARNTVARVDAARAEKFASDLKREPLTWKHGARVTLSVPRHDFRMLWLEDSEVPSTAP